MASRFNRYLCFEDYSPDQLIAIFLADAEKRVEHYIGELYQRRTEEGFRYGRDVRNPIEMIIAQKAEPIIILNEVDDATLVELTLSDAENALRLADSGICSKRPNVLAALWTVYSPLVEESTSIWLLSRVPEKTFACVGALQLNKHY